MHHSKPYRLNDLSKEEILAIRIELEKKKQLKKPKDKDCGYCGKTTAMRPDQIYCSAKCRKAAHDEKAHMLLEKLQQERNAWLIEREELIKEIQELRKRFL